MVIDEDGAHFYLPTTNLEHYYFQCFDLFSQVAGEEPIPDSDPVYLTKRNSFLPHFWEIFKKSKKYNFSNF